METENENEVETLQVNKYDFNKINGIRESIENMTKFNQISKIRSN